MCPCRCTRSGDITGDTSASLSLCQAIFFLLLFSSCLTKLKYHLIRSQELLWLLRIVMQELLHFVHIDQIQRSGVDLSDSGNTLKPSQGA
uniref:Uncharacterized protein n=1 Tax=uncultured marine virus TaxID=186617 RepID=A0A0F7L906_9VIRU|nr:hypothetical protein [uncultured marine virus]